MAERFDLVVVGGGIVGLSTAWAALQAFPRLRLAVLEKENRVAAHQSGHNSGVIHSGLYYRPGSQKAAMCVRGAAAMVAFCREHGIKHDVCGKLVVAVSGGQVPALQQLHQRGIANGINGLRLLSPEQAREIEPHCSCVQALQVPATAITDYAVVTRRLAELVTAAGGEVRTGWEVLAISHDRSPTALQTSQGGIETVYLLNCAGLHSDRIMRMAGHEPPALIVPFRGEYYELARPGLVRALIYPVPDPRFPFLGVHFTRRIGGGVEAGPNAVLAFKREGYSPLAFSLRDTAEAACWPGLWRMGARHWRTELGELHRSLRKRAFAASLQKMVPELRVADLRPSGSGVRAQALGRDGALIDDFLFVARHRMLHVCNVPSPAATASLIIGQAIMRMADESFGLESFRARRHETV